MQPEGNKREKLATLLESELNFHGENGNYSSHHFHAFAARFPPQLPRLSILGLTESGDIVLDPMMGSDTAIVEALLEGWRAVGLDIDPLALRLCQAKTMPVQIDSLRGTAQRVVWQAATLAKDKNIEQYLACLADIAAEIGFDLVGVVQRVLDRNKRMMPARFRKTDSMIEQRMHEEYVISLWNPPWEGTSGLMEPTAYFADLSASVLDR